MSTHARNDNSAGPAHDPHHASTPSRTPLQPARTLQDRRANSMNLGDEDYLRAVENWKARVTANKLTSPQGAPILPPLHLSPDDHATPAPPPAPPAPRTFGNFSESEMHARDIAYSAYVQTLDVSLPNDEFDALLFGPLVKDAIENGARVPGVAKRGREESGSGFGSEVDTFPITKRLCEQLRRSAGGHH